MSMSNFSLNSELSVVCFRRENSKQGPFFAVREFDTKVLRTRDKGRGRGRGPSEQAIRASIRQAILNMNLKSERATKAEIRLLKGHGILGKRAPSCSLLCAEDMIKLLEAFGKDDLVRDLRVALAKDKKLSPPSDDYRSLKAAQKIRKTPKIKTPPQEGAEAFPGKRQRLDSPSRMDTLLSALLALSDTDSSTSNETTSSPTLSLSPVSLSPVSPSKAAEIWSSPSPKYSIREEPSTPDSVNFQSTDTINFQFLPLPLESLAFLSSLDPASLCSPQGFAPIQGLTEFQGLSTPAVSGQVESQGFSGCHEPKGQGLPQVVLDHT